MKYTFQFQYTKSKRNQESFQGYVAGLFGSDAGIAVNISNDVIKVSFPRGYTKVSSVNMHISRLFTGIQVVSDLAKRTGIQPACGSSGIQQIRRHRGVPRRRA